MKRFRKIVKISAVFLVCILILSACKKTYHNQDGSLRKGFFDENGKTFFYNEKGEMQTGFITISGKKYYFDKDGALQTGWITVKDKKYYVNGKDGFYTGWQTVDGAQYYFNSDGSLAVNTIVDYKKLGTDGKVTATLDSVSVGKTTGNQKLDDQVKNLLDKICINETDKIKRMEIAYKWVGKNFRYKSIAVDVSKGFTDQLVSDLSAYYMNNRNGSCEHFAAIVKVLFDRLGVEDCYIVWGERYDSSHKQWGDHAWDMVKVNGQYYHVDGLFGANHSPNIMNYFMKPDKTLESTHKWDR